MPEIIGVFTGDAEIDSYALLWNEGSGAPNTAISGDPVFDTERTHTVAVSDPAGFYQFRYRVHNVHGWSESSQIVEIQAATVPLAPVINSIGLSGDELSVVIDWSLNAAELTEVEITAYSILILTNDDTTYEAETSSRSNCDGSDEAVITSR